MDRLSQHNGTYVNVGGEEVTSIHWGNECKPTVEKCNQTAATHPVPCTEILTVGPVRIEVVIITVVGVEILIWINSWVLSPGGTIDTVY
jgi:hypothetical protein